MNLALDTNFLIDAMRYHIDLEFDEKLQIVAPLSVVNELKMIAAKKSKESKYAALALDWIEKNKVKVVELKNKADEDLLLLAKEGFMIATNDKALRKKIKALGGKTIYLRERKKIAMG